MAMTAEELFWELVESMYADPAVQRSTMMGLPCVRIDGRFFACLDRSHSLVVKLPVARGRQLVDAGHGQPFAPAGRTFREWGGAPRSGPAPLARPACRGPRPRRRTATRRHPGHAISGA